MNEKLLAAHNRNIRLNDVVYRVIAMKLGTKVLADADPITGNTPRINLVKTRSELGRKLRELVDLGLFV